MSFSFLLRNGSFEIGKKGKLNTVENTDKLIQDSLKIVTTKLGSNTFFQSYGSLLGSIVVGSVLDIEFTNDACGQSIRTALDNLQKLQKQQTQSNQIVTAAEQLAAIKNVQVQQNVVNPTIFEIVIDILARDLNSTSIKLQGRL